MDPGDLSGIWVHSHEEDEGGTTVFRQESFDFPLSRGRKSFELRPDGSYAGSIPGPTDRPLPKSGRWTLAGDQLTLTGDSAVPVRWRVVSHIPSDRLVMTPAP